MQKKDWQKKQQKGRESNKPILNKIFYGNVWGNRYMTDVAFKTIFSLYRSFLMDLLYVVANTIWSIGYHTAWFGIFAFYHSILAGMRFLLLRYARHHEIGKRKTEELKLSRWCSIILLLLNLVLTAAVLMILYQDKGFVYHGILIYVMAIYTFYSTTMAIVNLVRYRKYHSALMSMTKVISFAASLVSMLSLETAMLAQFGNDTAPEVHWILIVATGAGVAGIIVVMAGYMIVKASRELKACS